MNQPTSIEEVLCKNYHHNRCQNQNCKRLHRFSTDDSVQRLIHTDELPKVFNTNIAWLSKGGANYVPIKEGNHVNFFIYNPENNQMQPVNFQHENEQEIIYFKCEQDYLLYTFENPVNKLWSIAIFNLEQQRRFVIANTHQKTITGLTMINDNIVSVSHDGFIKVWSFNTTKNEFEINSEITNIILNKLEGASYMFNFCKVFFVGGVQTLWVGTRCGKLLVFNLSTGLELIAKVAVPKYVAELLPR